MLPSYCQTAHNLRWVLLLRSIFAPTIRCFRVEQKWAGHLGMWNHHKGTSKLHARVYFGNQSYWTGQELAGP